MYVGGNFQSVGTGIPVYNIAKLSNGVWQAIPDLLVENSIVAMTSYQSTIYFAGAPNYRSTGEKLSIQGYDTLGQNVSFSYLPRFLSSYNLLETMYADATFVYVGGFFIVLLQDDTVASGGDFLLFHLGYPYRHSFY